MKVYRLLLPSLLLINVTGWAAPETRVDQPPNFIVIFADDLGYRDVSFNGGDIPTPAIDRNSHDYRPLGLGYANLGSLIMSEGLPYDSDAGRAYAAAVTGLIHGEANRMSALIAADRGPFEEYDRNAAPMMAVMEKLATLFSTSSFNWSARAPRKNTTSRAESQSAVSTQGF